MYILMHSNCDNPTGSVWDKFKEKPVASELADILNDYYDEATVKSAVEDLLSMGECDIEKSDCPHFEIQKI